MPCNTTKATPGKTHARSCLPGLALRRCISYSRVRAMAAGNARIGSFVMTP
jgi:hypothetical protein